MDYIFLTILLIACLVSHLVGFYSGVLVTDGKKQEKLINAIRKKKSNTVIFDEQEKTLADLVNEKKPQGEVYLDSFLDDVNNNRI